MKRDVFEMVEEFHEVYGVPIGVEPNKESVELRDDLIYEEYSEVQREFFPFTGLSDEPDWENIDKKKLTKELADLMYVVIGTAITFGLPLKEVFEEVHKSNMSKLGLDGKPVYREDGKVLKGPNYKEPDLERFFT